ncbi:CCA tRNA nucleotidyltransferase [Deinococcus sp. SL84]|uniref:CCA tRNA nucleotidyltransferase n=1 Tax=Deinococcus sp. SL84 TaxID=2994663 RepID=UPI002276A548|nr:CCA tRNA nucleotidyltransferase [Deinococcus sp. SL84]MCY1701729.1 CCA tRNA nucleotidyltransferase [Deinococcus sp. SL84]
MPAAHASAQAVWNALAPADRVFLSGLVQDAAGQGTLALVGGAVRDALLGASLHSPDLDIVLDTSGGLTVGELAARYSARTGLPHLFHPQFQNAALTLPDGRSADLIRARRERYPVPGERPTVTTGTLAEDLARRDFGLNALALRLADPPELLDVVGGLDDLHARTLRPLHAHLLHEDASRLIRGARLAARLDLHAHPELLRQVPDALQMAERTPRLWAELGLALHEPHPTKVARMLTGWGAGEVLPPGLLPTWQQLEAAGAGNPDLYAAALLHTAEHPQLWQERLSLGHGPARLLARAESADIFPAESAEQQLRTALWPERPAYPPLQGRDLLQAGWTAGPQLGQALAHLRTRRARGELHSRAEEWAALHEWQARPGNKGNQSL